MIPSILSQQINQGINDFLSTTFHSTNPFFHNMLERFLGQEGNLSKGPYISLQLPFQKGHSREFFPKIPMGLTTHLHQELAFARLWAENAPETLRFVVVDELHTFDGAQRTDLVCISEAKSKEDGQVRPFVYARVQHWYREIRRMVCSVDRSPELRFSDDLTEDQRTYHLPLLHCRECGQTGWIGRLPLHGSTLQTDLKSIYSDQCDDRPAHGLQVQQ